MWLEASSAMFLPVFWCDVQYKIALYYCRLSQVDSVAFSQFWNVLLLFSGVMFSIRSFFTIAVYLR